MKKQNPNQQGKYTKEWVISNNYEIYDSGVTATEIYNVLGVKLTQEERLEHCIGFVTQKGWRGYAPVFDILDIGIKASKGTFNKK